MPESMRPKAEAGCLMFLLLIVFYGRNYRFLRQKILFSQPENIIFSLRKRRFLPKKTHFRVYLINLLMLDGISWLHADLPSTTNLPPPRKPV